MAYEAERRGRKYSQPYSTLEIRELQTYLDSMLGARDCSRLMEDPNGFHYGTFTTASPERTRAALAGINWNSRHILKGLGASTHLLFRSPGRLQTWENVRVSCKKNGKLLSSTGESANLAHGSIIALALV
jgi:hypothetical protein